MAEFKPNVPVIQTDPTVSVDPTTGSPLPAGKYRFQLVVIDDAGTQSDPAFLDVIIKDKLKPTAVLDMVNSDKVVINPASVTTGQSFLLSGARSSEVAPGQVVSYQFTLLPAQ